VKLNKAEADKMISQRTVALRAGWGGAALFLASWLMINRISAFSVTLWVGLMTLGALMCFYAGVLRSKWFLLPAFAAVLVIAGVFAAVYVGG
jgi:hypothetical protein